MAPEGAGGEEETSKFCPCDDSVTEGMGGLIFPIFERDVIYGWVAP